MKTVFLTTAALLIATANAQATTRKPDPFTDGARVDAAIQQVAARSTSPKLVDEQYRTLAVRKADPYVDGAVRSIDPFTDGAAKPVDALTDGA
ncbi:hypothetical protein LMG23992_00866 [Cupriavidus laharis]|uniref:DUF4148 domain-containing protein n=1 Tax=Cupriavidus laharis TaxID=151654 RepID=A0ABM8WJT4_9BURK|nr:hypothetical protein [Cupriavidus laharis]CAG9167647.1 hypothetical protein LMG23992_00866 [Cupriavidus laharis]